MGAALRGCVQVQTRSWTAYVSVQMFVCQWTTRTWERSTPMSTEKRLEPAFHNTSVRIQSTLLLLVLSVACCPRGQSLPTISDGSPRSIKGSLRDRSGHIRLNGRSAGPRLDWSGQQSPVWACKGVVTWWQLLPLRRLGWQNTNLTQLILLCLFRLWRRWL